jgi:hypothetical protein
MGKAIPTQHPAVVLRSNYRQLRALLAIAMTAVVGLTAALVILATNDDRETGAGSATQLKATPAESVSEVKVPTCLTRNAPAGSIGLIRPTELGLAQVAGAELCRPGGRA